MSANGLEVFDKTLQTTHIWLDEVMAAIGPDRKVAWKVLSTVLHKLRDRIPVELAAHLGSQLPLLVRGVYYDQFQPARQPTACRSYDEFCSEVAEWLRDTRPSIRSWPSAPCSPCFRGTSRRARSRRSRTPCRATSATPGARPPSSSSRRRPKASPPATRRAGRPPTARRGLSEPAGEIRRAAGTRARPLHFSPGPLALPRAENDRPGDAPPTTRGRAGHPSPQLTIDHQRAVAGLAWETRVTPAASCRTDSLLFSHAAPGGCSWTRAQPSWAFSKPRPRPSSGRMSTSGAPASPDTSSSRPKKAGERPCSRP